jgi:hypothetical protein
MINKEINHQFQSRFVKIKIQIRVWFSKLKMELEFCFWRTGLGMESDSQFHLCVETVVDQAVWAGYKVMHAKLATKYCLAFRYTKLKNQ